MTRITINLPLVDARVCQGCAYWDLDDDDAYPWCMVFQRRLPLPNTLRERLPECLAAEVEEVQR